MNIEERVIRIEQQISQFVRLGTVVEANTDKGSVRVEFPDLDAMISYDLPVVFTKTMKDKDYSMPDIAEQVLCIFLPFGTEQGFVIGAVYSNEDPPPVSSMDKKHYLFSDGTVLEYDREKHQLTIDVKGDVFLIASKDVSVEATGSCSVKATTIELN